MRVATGFSKALGASFALMAALGTSTVAAAQDRTPQQNAAAQATGELSRLRLSCADFERNRDNTWSPVRSITIGVTAVSPTASFRAGETAGGADVGAILDRECNQQAGQPSGPPPR
jgi:hypothetical protein